MPTNKQIYEKLNAIESLLLQLLNALNKDDSEPIQYDFEGLPMPLQRDDNKEL